MTDGTLVSDKQGKLRCWKEFYNDMLNRRPVNPPDSYYAQYPSFFSDISEPVMHQGNVVSLLNY